MEHVKSGQKVLYIWGGDMNSSFEAQINELKAIGAQVNVENIDRLQMASYPNSTFDVVLSNLLATYQQVHSIEVLGNFLKLIKLGGTIALKDAKPDDVSLNLTLSGFINIAQSPEGVFSASKPYYEVGSAQPLSVAKKQKVWKLDDTEEDDLINPDDLLDDEDKKKPDPSSLRVCGTTGKRKACKDCSCGLADELEAEKKGSTVAANPIQKSSCGSCYLGDAFRCASCPYLGMPAFKPGEKIKIPENQLKADL